ncbi:MAG: hypothetical protein NC120_10115, partial [Ruminococcus sp.]|nr:hypothetical protein [Ruminococcus sp.]
MSSSKGKKNPNKPANAVDPNKNEAANTSEQTKKIGDGYEEENIPVQSLSEMLAFAHEAEAKLDEKDTSAPKAEAEKKSGENPNREEKSAPKAEAEKKSGEKPNPEEKSAPKAEAEKKSGENSNPEERSAPESRNGEKTSEKVVHRAPDGMPISASEAERQAASEDALDRDLEAARKKKLREEAYHKRQREEEAKREAERIARAEKIMERQQNAAEAAAQKAQQAKKAEAETAASNAAAPAAQKESSQPKKKNAVARYFNRRLFSMAAARAVVIGLVIVLLAYGGAFIYVNSRNEIFFKELETRLNSQSRLVSDESIPYTISPASQLNADEKLKDGLALGL